MVNLSNVSTSNTVVISKPNSLVSELQKQKMELSKQIANINAGKEDAKTKAEKIKNINEQIAELDKQIMQAQIAEKQKELEESQRKNAEKMQKEQQENADSTQKEGVVLSASLNQLLQANQGHLECKDMNAVRVRLIGEQRVAQGQVRNSHGGSTRYQMDVISEKGSRISDLTDKMAKKMEDISQKIDTARKLGEKEAESDAATKIDEAKVNQKYKDEEGEKLTVAEETEGLNVTNSDKGSININFEQEDKEKKLIKKTAKEYNTIDIIV